MVHFFLNFLVLDSDKQNYGIVSFLEVTKHLHSEVVTRDHSITVAVNLL